MAFKQFVMYGSMLFSTYALTISGQDQFPSINQAAFYQNHSQQQWEVAFEALKRIRFQGNERILDIGCGPGKVTANMAGRVPYGSVIGVDICQGMIDFAEKTYMPFYKNLAFVKCDIRELFLSSSFDMIFSSSTLHWVLDHQSLLIQLRCILNDQGTILFTIPCAPLPEVSAIFQDILLQEPWQSYLKAYNHPRRKFNSEEYSQLLHQTGFKDIEVMQVPFTYYFETKRELADWFAAYSPMLFYIPSEMHESFLIYLAEHYLESIPLDEEGRVVFKQNELIIKAQKRDF